MKNKIRSNSENIRKIVYLALLTAIVLVFQTLGSFIRLGPFQASLVLIPIVIGAALLGPGAGAWLGFVFGMHVLLSGDAAAFLTIDVVGTVLVVLVKGIVCGMTAGFVFKILKHVNQYLAVLISAIACPLANTGIFLLGCKLFFMEAVSAWANAEGMSAVAYMFIGLVGGNFIFEFILNIIFVPVILRLLNFKNRI
ncbi:MAG: ECF transporter S component [Clostridia bacterium]|nr:ECF transporter S component [Clostridia bacterium]